MDRHLEIVEALANGINPQTGEVLPSESPYNSPDVIRALFYTLDFVKNPPKKATKVKKSLEQKQEDNVANGLPKNAGLPWSQEQRDDLRTQFISGVGITVLAENHGRTNGAITSELKKQGLIED
ncbi:conserved hypothetical protein [Vibrio nigripulchritudo MADA3029]|uniref:Uncharacterized protein n=1 Tax=Vibrio nigripulchritudo TaxID=28173 RepID=U4KIR7_9VIBR|nr:MULTISPECIES: hypothetical protein [Vibrio]KJY75269.1 hypothetical protein TW74_18235 [Vibrio nigripulchritudo]UAB72633.1 hypothetical protein INR79_25580 [Vibrio sp. SCSIO 43132]CCN49901.1 conserved hypothetical protein [Vibrio nigripulchritudo MADA3020]CCN56457.1 conserved hypothetical protein [Vibrio nigripulchritudo MADA3021]CCN62050.1 conserved hypothetical protein [Vibrio nigripulchritudo MADA3029]